jgi:uncharacterized protein
MRKIIVYIIFFAIATAAPASAINLSSGVERGIRERLAKLGLTDYVLDLNVRVPVPGFDGQPAVDLWATIIRPVPDKKLPVILLATPYRREYFLPYVENLLSHDYAVMVVDIRGTGSSAGQWVSFDLVEQNDIVSIIDEWIPGQSWSDGRVGMIGPSYCAIIQLLAAGRVACNAQGEPQHLKAIMPIEAMSDTYRDIVMQGGNLDLGFIPLWIFGIDMGALKTPLLLEDAGLFPDEEVLAEAAAIVQSHREQISTNIGWIMDYNHADESLFYEIRSPMIYWPEKPAAGWDFQQGDFVLPEKLPVFLSTGWFDLFLRGTLNNYRFGLSRHAPADKSLVIGQWYHGDGALWSGIDGLLGGDIPARWFDWKIKGTADPFMQEFPVLLYVMGAEKWRAEKSWPLSEPRLSGKTLFLTNQKPAAIQNDWFSVVNREFNYSLTDNVPGLDAGEGTPVLIHNPDRLHGEKSRSQVRWGGRMSTAWWDDLLDERQDEIGVLTFTTEPLQQDLEIVGPLLLSFWARTEFDRPLKQEAVQKTIGLIKKIFNIDTNLLLDLMDREDVQWVVEVNDVFPGGRAKNITSGWLSAWHRPYDPVELPGATEHRTDPSYTPFDPFYDGPDKAPRPIRAEELYQYAIELWPMDCVFKAGHRVRVSISASDFPHLLPVLRPSTSTLVIDSAHPAQLDFTVALNSGEGIEWKWVEDVNRYLTGAED